MMFYVFRECVYIYICVCLERERGEERERMSRSCFQNSGRVFLRKPGFHIHWIGAAQPSYFILFYFYLI